MAAIMNGLALHKGVIPFGGTFLIFLDYCKPSLRLAALMKQRAIYILTHDSIGLGEDGPTHQPVEQLASLRATPNVNVFRPADTIETAESWQLALENKKSPSVIALTRQKLTPARKKYTNKNLTGQGAYELANNSKNPEVSIYASGSEVEIASQLANLLIKKKVSFRIISVPCFELFKLQNKQYKKTIFGHSKVNVAIEAGSSMGWNEICPNNLIHASIDGFGASAPYKKLYDFYGLTAEKIYKKIIKKI
jgi:transketolase